MTQPHTRSIIAAQQDTLAIEDSGYVAGIDIGGTNLRLALADMDGVIAMA
jgi:glucokinase